MTFLLDTDICIYLLNGHSGLKSKIEEIGLANCGISNITLCELYFGAYNSAKVQSNLERVRAFSKELIVCRDNVEANETFGALKAELKKKGKPVGDFDIMIASIALSNKLNVVTNNSEHFKHFQNLKIENWLRT